MCVVLHLQRVYWFVYNRMHIELGFSNNQLCTCLVKNECFQMCQYLLDILLVTIEMRTKWKAFNIFLYSVRLILFTME